LISATVTSITDAIAVGVCLIRIRD
jgi:hypothetical protein